jgi:hypothetical protein
VSSPIHLLKLVRIKIAVAFDADRSDMLIVLPHLENVKLLQLDRSRRSTEHSSKFRETPFHKQRVTAGSIDFYPEL